MIEFEQDIKRCVSILESGGLILFSTDTSWVIGCNALNEEMVQQLASLTFWKGEVAFNILMADAQMLRHYLANPIPGLEDLVEAQKQESLAIIFEDVIGVAAAAFIQNGTVCIQIPKDAFCIALLKRFRKPIATATAQFGAVDDSILFSQIATPVRQLADYAVQWRQSDVHFATKLTILRLCSDGSLRKFR